MLTLYTQGLSRLSNSCLITVVNSAERASCFSRLLVHLRFTVGRRAYRPRKSLWLTLKSRSMSSCSKQVWRAQLCGLVSLRSVIVAHEILLVPVHAPCAPFYLFGGLSCYFFCLSLTFSLVFLSFSLLLSCAPFSLFVSFLSLCLLVSLSFPLLTSLFFD